MSDRRYTDVSSIVSISFYKEKEYFQFIYVKSKLHQRLRLFVLPQTEDLLFPLYNGLI